MLAARVHCRKDISLGEDTEVINLTFIFILITLISTLIVGSRWVDSS